MLTSLSFLDIGKVWPPEEEKDRLNVYSQNRRIFEGDHFNIYGDAYKRIQRVIGNFDDIVSYETLLNFQKKVSVKTADFLFIEEPIFRAGDEDGKEQKALDAIKTDNELNYNSYQAGLDVSRYGTGLYHIYHNGKAGVISIVPPETWFPVVDKINIKRINYHVLARVYSEKSGNETNYYLNCQIHESGKYEERTYSLKTSNGGLTYTLKSILESKIVATGLSDFAVVPVHNLLTSDRYYGIDDYHDIDSIVSGLMVRVGQVDKILDAHADPSLSGTPSAVHQDPVTGEYRLKLGNYFIRDDKEDPPPEYITWDGSLSDCFTEIEKLVTFLCVISEMGTAIFDNSENLGAAASGTALKLRYINPLTKTARLRMSFDPALKKVIKLCSELGPVKLDNVSITWQDGLPSNSREEAEIINLRTAGKPTMSKKTALRTYDGLTEKEADAEIERIQEDETLNNPLSVPPGGGFLANEDMENGSISNKENS